MPSSRAVIERAAASVKPGSSEAELLARINESGADVHAPTAGYLQFVAYSALVDIAAGADERHRLLHRPGHFVVEGLPLARVWPAECRARGQPGAESDRMRPGAHRTLSQDLRSPSTSSWRSPSAPCRPR